METAATAIYHCVLIGIDRYPARYRSLSGCVNDIDAITELLLAAPGVGIPPERIRITRLAAVHPGRPDPVHPVMRSLPPTKANVVQTLKELAGPEIKRSDRVLIYYSGHGDEKAPSGGSVWHEALVPHNDREIEYLFDVEVNALVQAIAARGTDVTVILDCCHSAGATRELTGVEPDGKVRALQGGPATVILPDPSTLGLGAPSGRAVTSSMLLESDPDYVVVVACQSDEKASEGICATNEPAHGVFTASLLTVLRKTDPAKLPGLRWAEIWPELLAETATRNTRLKQRAQHPWIIGRSERRIFGGPWEKMDLGYTVTRLSDGKYEVGAGTLMGITAGAEIAVYGAEPRLFPPAGSPDNHPVGRLCVIGATPSTAVASVAGAPFDLPAGARGRLDKPGESQRLRVSLKQPDAAVESQLRQSQLLEVVSSTDPDADVEVVAVSGRGWIIGNDVEAVMGAVPAGEAAALRAGLEHYYRYNTVLRMARNCVDPQLSGSLSVKLLDCDDEAALSAMSPQDLADPKLPEARRDNDLVYSMRKQGRFCIRVANCSRYDLNVSVFNCSAMGLVEYLSDALLRGGAAHVMWLDNNASKPFVAAVDEGPLDTFGAEAASYATDRVVAIGTTRRSANLRSLAVDQRVQEVVDQALSSRRRGEKSMAGAGPSRAPVELWTASVTPVRITAG